MGIRMSTIRGRSLAGWRGLTGCRRLRQRAAPRLNRGRPSRRARRAASAARCCRTSGSSGPMTRRRANMSRSPATLPASTRRTCASPAKPLTFAFAEGWAAIPFSVSINKGIYKIAGDLGINIIYCDQEFKPEKAVTCAEQLSQQKPDFAIVSNWQSGAAEAIMKIYDAAKIPVVNIDVWHPNGIFFGADNYISGEIGGKAAGEYAKGARQVRRRHALQRHQPRRGRRRRPAHRRLHRRRPGSLRRHPGGPHQVGNLRRRHHRAGADQDDRLADRQSRRHLHPRHLDRRRPLRRHLQGAGPERTRRGRGRPRLRRDRRRRHQGRRSGHDEVPRLRRLFPGEISGLRHVDRPRRPRRQAGARTRCISSTSSSTRRSIASVYP